MQNRRYFSNHLKLSNIERRLAHYLYASGGVFVAFVCTFLLTNMVMDVALMFQVNETTGPFSLGVLEELERSVVEIVIILAFAGFLFFLFGIFLLNRITGPMIPIEKYVDQLLDGKTNLEPISLREHDEFRSLAEKINQLGDQLSKK